MTYYLTSAVFYHNVTLVTFMVVLPLILHVIVTDTQHQCRVLPIQFTMAYYPFSFMYVLLTFYLYDVRV